MALDTSLCTPKDPHCDPDKFSACGINLRNLEPCVKQAELCTRFGVEAYPTVKYFRKREYVKDFDGERTSGGIVSWLVDEYIAGM